MYHPKINWNHDYIKSTKSFYIGGGYMLHLAQANFTWKSEIGTQWVSCLSVTPQKPYCNSLHLSY